MSLANYFRAFFLFTIAVVLVNGSRLSIADQLDIKAKSIAEVLQDNILFVSNRDGDYDIYLMKLASGEVKQLTHNNHDDMEAVASPDGQKILFTSSVKGNSDIFVMNANGSSLTRLTTHPGLDSSAQWSPDGKKIAFVSDRHRYINVYVMDADGSNVINISQTKTAAMKPLWSPDGRVIAFEHSNSVKSKNIMLSTPNGSTQSKLTKTLHSNDFDMAWSPDGSKIAYVSMRKKLINIYVIDSTGKNEIQLTNTPWIDAAPSWSSDSKKLAFLSTRDDGARRQVYVIHADGSNEHRVGQSGAEEMNVIWSSQDAYMFYVSYQDGNAELYQYNVLNTKSTRLTHHIAHDYRPLLMPQFSTPLAPSFNDSTHDKVGFVKTRI